MVTAPPVPLFTRSANSWKSSPAISAVVLAWPKRRVCACAAPAMKLPAIKAATAMRFKIMLVLPDVEPGRFRPRGSCSYLISRS
jgi:hypothetical protein